MTKKAINDVTAEEVDMLVPGFKEALETPDDKVIDKPEEDDEDSQGGNQSEEGENEDEEKGDEGAEEDSSQKEGQKDSPKEEGQPGTDVAAAISKANAKTQGELDAIAKLMQGKPELLEKLKEENESLYNKLEKRMPEVFRPIEEVKAEDKAGKLSAMLENLLKSQEDQEMDVWRKSNKITKADFDERKEQQREYAITLVDEGLVPDWKKALDVAGRIVFPHLSGKPVDETKLKKMGGQNISVGKTLPSKSEYTQEELRIMKDNNLTEEEFATYQRGNLMPPGIF